MTDTEYDEALAGAEAERDTILRGTCPRCAGSMPGTPDKRQGGWSGVAGTWWNHECANCGYRCDVVHSGQQKGLA